MTKLDKSERFELLDPTAIENPNVFAKHVPLVQRVHPIFLDLFQADTPEGEEFRLLLSAAFPEDAIEGTLRDDNTAAAMMLRQAARVAGNTDVGSQTLKDLRAAIGRCLRKHGLDRKTRSQNILD